MKIEIDNPFAKLKKIGRCDFSPSLVYKWNFNYKCVEFAFLTFRVRVKWEI